MEVTELNHDLWLISETQRILRSSIHDAWFNIIKYLLINLIIKKYNQHIATNIWHIYELKPTWFGFPLIGPSSSTASKNRDEWYDKVPKIAWAFLPGEDLRNFIIPSYLSLLNQSNWLHKPVSN